MNCDAAITWAALEPVWPLRIVLNGGKGARGLCPHIDQSLDTGCHLGLVHSLGNGGYFQLKVVCCEEPSHVLPITNRLRAPALKGEGMVQSWAVPHSILPASYFLSLGPNFHICLIPAPVLCDSINPPSLLLLTPPFLLGYTQFNIPALLQCLQHLLLDCQFSSVQSLNRV